jgi:hypothetical protein
MATKKISLPIRTELLPLVLQKTAEFNGRARLQGEDTVPGIQGCAGITGWLNRTYVLSGSTERRSFLYEDRTTVHEILMQAYESDSDHERRLCEVRRSA